MKSLPLKLAPGSDLLISIEKVGREQNSNGFVLGVVGNLSRACFQCPGRSKPTLLEGNLEIITLNGTFTPEGVHLHLSLSDKDCQVWGGHLEPGTLVNKGADVLVGLLNEEFSYPDSNIVSKNSTESRLEVAVMPGCPWSTRALRILKSLDVPHKINTIDSDESFLALKNRSGLTTFPQIFIDGELLGGYDSLAEFHSSGKLNDYK